MLSYNIIVVLCVMLYNGPAFGSCALQTLVKICFFNNVYAKKLKKEETARKLSQNSAPKKFFQVSPQTLVKGFIPRKIFLFHNVPSKTGVFYFVYYLTERTNALRPCKIKGLFFLGVYLHSQAKPGYPDSHFL